MEEILRVSRSKTCIAIVLLLRCSILWANEAEDYNSAFFNKDWKRAKNIIEILCDREANSVDLLREKTKIAGIVEDKANFIAGLNKLRNDFGVSGVEAIQNIVFFPEVNYLALDLAHTFFVAKGDNFISTLIKTSMEKRNTALSHEKEQKVLDKSLKPGIASKTNEYKTFPTEEPWPASEYQNLASTRQKMEEFVNEIEQIIDSIDSQVRLMSATKGTSINLKFFTQFLRLYKQKIEVAFARILEGQLEEGKYRFAEALNSIKNQAIAVEDELKSDEPKFLIERLEQVNEAIRDIKKN